MSGIGLSTPRGSGTSGHVQKNIVSKKFEGTREKRRREVAEEHRREVRIKTNVARQKAGVEVHTHDQKRQIEVQCMELRESLEDQGIDDKEIEVKVGNYRKELVEKLSERTKELEFRRSQHFEHFDRKGTGDKVYVDVESNTIPEAGSSVDTIRNSSRKKVDESVEKVDDVVGTESSSSYVPRYNNR